MNTSIMSWRTTIYTHNIFKNSNLLHMRIDCMCDIFFVGWVGGFVKCDDVYVLILRKLLVHVLI